MDGEHGSRPRRAARVRPRLVKIGDRRILARGLDAPIFGDLYYQAMRVTWPVFFAGCASIFLIANVVFALLYSLGSSPVANARPGHLLDLFFFSIETIATVGYGDMHPQTIYGHSIATLEIFTGMSSLAVVTGLIFSRFSRSRASLVFARHPVIGPHDGRRCLMIRIANARHNMIPEATAKLWVVLEEEIAEGTRYRRFHELPLQRAENPVFVLSWTLFHVIDESSLLFGLDPAQLQDADAAFVVTFSGVDGYSNQRVNARHTFSHREIRWEHQFVDVLGTTNEGLPMIDYSKFHDTAPAQGPAPAA